ncbi:MAG TPA: Rne/Rng family ribonuclease [Coleofasciculaceae cyanobacterium]|jgi:ribonuclease E
MAKRKIIISEYDNIAALMEEDRAVEFIIHRGDMLLGDVYLATVENILPSIDAAFVNVGGDKMGFLHSSDVPGKGDLKNRLEPKQQLVVQIMKEPTGHKGPRVSTNISLPGRFLVMMPESKGISISRKIQEVAERSRLKSIVSLIKPPGVGVIIRTEAEAQKESDITEDFETLLERWQNIVSMADTATPPTLLYRDQDLLYRVIREAVTEDVVEIVVDTAFGQQRAQQLLQNWNMDKGVKVTHYQGNQPILVGTGVDKEIKLALNTKVPMPSGGYLYIQPTEALTVVDVNSGKFTSLQSQAETIKLTNLEACKEIARQLRLRNIGGMIIVDFIDMESRANQLQVMQTFENELAPDKAKPQIGQLSDLGLVEMTRHRQGQSLSEIFTRRCTTCNGTGHALEEFAWMNGSEGGDRGRQRNKLPMRQPNRQQPVPKPAASLNKRDRGGRVAINLVDGKQDKGPQTNVTPGNILLTNIAERKPQRPGQPAPQEQEATNMAEAFGDKIQKALGVRFSGVAKLSYMPIGINSVLTRINPKANDIVSLVHSIEAAASMPMHRYQVDDMESGEFEGDDAYGSEGSEEDAEPEMAVAAVNGRPRYGRNRAPVVEDDGEEATQGVLEIEVPDAPEEQRPRRGRQPRRQQEESVDDLEVLQPADEVEDASDDQEMDILVDEDDADESDNEDDNRFDSDDSVDLLDSEDDEGDEAEASGSAVAVAKEGLASKRRGGRPQKRTIKKPTKR